MVIVYEQPSDPVVRLVSDAQDVPYGTTRILTYGERRALIVEAARDLALNGFALRVLILIDEHYNMRTGRAWPSRQKLATMMKDEAEPDRAVKPQAVTRALTLLEKRGYLIRHKNGRRNEYELASAPLFSHHADAVAELREQETPVLPIQETPVFLNRVRKGNARVTNQEEQETPVVTEQETPALPRTIEVEPEEKIEPIAATTSPGEQPPKTGAAATKSGRLIDALRARGIQVAMRPQDHRALKDATNVEPEDVAETYAAIHNGEWGDEKSHLYLTVQNAIGKVNGYKAFKANPNAFRRVGNKGPKAGTQTDW